MWINRSHFVPLDNTKIPHMGTWHRRSKRHFNRFSHFSDEKWRIVEASIYNKIIAVINISTRPRIFVNEHPYT